MLPTLVDGFERGFFPVVETDSKFDLGNLFLVSNVEQFREYICEHTLQEPKLPMALEAAIDEAAVEEVAVTATSAVDAVAVPSIAVEDSAELEAAEFDTVDAEFEGVDETPATAASISSAVASGTSKF